MKIEINGVPLNDKAHINILEHIEAIKQLMGTYKYHYEEIKGAD